MRSIIFFISMICCTITSMAQRYTDRSYEITGLTDGDEVVESLKIGIPLILLGILIAYIFMWRKSEEEKEIQLDV